MLPSGHSELINVSIDDPSLVGKLTTAAEAFFDGSTDTLLHDDFGDFKDERDDIKKKRPDTLNILIQKYFGGMPPDMKTRCAQIRLRLTNYVKTHGLGLAGVFIELLDINGSVVRAIGGTDSLELCHALPPQRGKPETMPCESITDGGKVIYPGTQSLWICVMKTREDFSKMASGKIHPLTSIADARRRDLVGVRMPVVDDYIFNDYMWPEPRIVTPAESHRSMIYAVRRFKKVGVK